MQWYKIMKNPLFNANLNLLQLLTVDVSIFFYILFLPIATNYRLRLILKEMNVI